MNAENGRLLRTCLLSQMHLCQFTDLHLAYMQRVTMVLERRGLLMPPEETMATELRMLRDEAKSLHLRLQNRARQLADLYSQ